MELVVVLALILGSVWVILSIMPISSWSDKRLDNFVSRNSDLRYRLLIDQINMDQNVASAKAKEYQELDEKIKQVELEIERRKSRPVVMTPDAASWLAQNSDLVSQVAALQSIDIIQARQIMIEERRRWIDKFANQGKEKSIQVADKLATSVFRNKVSSK